MDFNLEKLKIWQSVINTASKIVRFTSKND